MNCFKLVADNHTWWFDAESKGVAWEKARHFIEKSYFLQKEIKCRLYQNQSFLLGTCGKRRGKFFIEKIKRKKDEKSTESS